MKHLNTYITEYIIKKKLVKPIYSGTSILYTPKNNGELADLIIKLLNDDETNLNCIDVSNIKVMQNLFDYVNDNVIVKDIDISEWDVSNVIDMTEMFTNCNKFNCDLSKWDVSKVKYMDNMFDSCYNFTGKGLENWDVSNVTNMEFMFAECDNFEGKSIENWDVSNVENMEDMFENCKNFNCDLSNWDVSNVKHMDEMFVNCSKFKGKGLENWNVSNIEPTNMSDMFDNCKSLKKPSWYNGNT